MALFLRLSPPALGHLAMLAFSCLVAGSFSLGALVAQDLAPAPMTALRFALAALVLGGVALAGRGGIPRASLVAPWRYAALALLYGGYFVLMFHALQIAPPVSVAAVFTLSPALSGLFGWLLLRQVTTPRMAAAVAIGGAGALWVIFRADLGAFLAFEVGRGEALFFAGCVLYALYAPLLRIFHRGERPVVFTFWTLAASALVVSAAALPELLATDWGALPLLVWPVLVYLALCATVASSLLILAASRRLPSVKVMAYTFLVPSWVILWELALGHGAPRALVLVGVALTAAALVMLLRDEEARRLRAAG
jgi:drug/metabolite transporter (DMT)-like permease